MMLATVAELRGNTCAFITGHHNQHPDKQANMVASRTMDMSAWCWFEAVSCLRQPEIELVTVARLAQGSRRMAVSGRSRYTRVEYHRSIATGTTGACTTGHWSEQ